MKILKLNLELSKKLVEDMACMDEHIELKGCYNNTFKAITIINILREYNLKDYSVAYGFVDKNIGSSKMYFRHAFLINNKEGCVVDVTACLWKESDESYLDYNYYIFKEYKDLETYTDALIRENGMPALHQDTKESEVAAVNKLSKKGMEYNPIDLMDLLSRVYGRNFMQGIEDYKKNNVIVLN